jgi:hypothetical protein
MIKEARKPSMDPAQEKLRRSKAVWNKSISALINDIIHAKKLMNGWPSKYFKERGKIINPIPADATSILNTLASQFQELSQEGAAIAQQQVQYSQSRRQKRTDQGNQTLDKLDEKYGPNTVAPAAPTAPVSPTGDDLSKQLAAWDQKYSLVAEASNPFSRFLARMKTRQMGFGPEAQKRRLQMNMLKASLKSYRALGKFQVQITKSSKDSIMTAYKDVQEAWNQWSIVSRNFNAYVNMLPDQAPRPEEMKDEVFMPEKEDVNLPAQNNKPATVVTNKPFDQDISNKTVEETIANEPPIKEKKKPEQKKNVPLPVSEELPDTFSKLPVNNASAQLEAVAQAFLQKWLGKTRHQILPGSSSGLRLQAFDVATSTRKNIDMVMDALEKGLNPDEMGPKMSEVSSQINSLRSLMRSLHTTEKPVKGQPPSPFAGMF